jgi:hypothetical protein
MWIQGKRGMKSAWRSWRCLKRASQLEYAERFPH